MGAAEGPLHLAEDAEGVPVLASQSHLNLGVSTVVARHPRGSQVTPANTALMPSVTTPGFPLSGHGAYQ